MQNKKVKIIKLEEKYVKFIDNYSKLELLIALTLALSSKLISSKDVCLAVNRLTANKKHLKDSMDLSNKFLKFIKEDFLREEI